MKVIIVVFIIIGLTAALPNAQRLGFKNLYVDARNTSSNSRPRPRIVGGHEAEPNSIPYQAFLTVFGLGEGWYCGGSLISETRVLTAGHCGDGAFSARIVLGAHRALEDEDTQVIAYSSNIVVHPEFDIEIIANDVAVVKLDEAVALTNAIQIVALASDPAESYEGAIATVSGWGLIDGSADSISDVLNTLDSTIISNAECAAAFDIVQDSNICITGEENTGSCNGDSGGPLTVDGIQVGVVSFGETYCSPGYPTGFARITNFLDFINANL